MLTTAKLGLKKPEDADGFGQDDFNFNSDLIEAILGTSPPALAPLHLFDGSDKPYNNVTVGQYGDADAGLFSGDLVVPANQPHIVLVTFGAVVNLPNPPTYGFEFIVHASGATVYAPTVATAAFNTTGGGITGATGWAFGMYPLLVNPGTTTFAFKGRRDAGAPVTLSKRQMNVVPFLRLK